MAKQSRPHPTATDWSARYAMADETVVFRAGGRGEGGRPRVTIGMPTYRRGAVIRRALESIAAQTYRDFVLVISDNNGDDPVTQEAVRAMADAFPEVVLIAQPENIGVMQNLLRLIGLAETEYFMWLADDDEISPNYLEELVGLLDADPEMVSAQGQWRKMLDGHTFVEPDIVEAGQGGRAARLARFIALGRDDTLFYGVHRVEALRKTRFEGYFWPNREMLTNFCYVQIFDLLWQGRVGYSKSAYWTSHNYSVKGYTAARAASVKDRAKTLVRRVNVHWLYLRKTASRNPALLTVVAPAAAAGFGYDIASAVGRFAGRAIGKRGK